MNLALRDIRHNLSRFLLTALGIGMLLMIVMAMGGIYQGLIEDATLLIDSIGADLWVVQYGTRGPFAEISRIPRNLEDRLQAVPGSQERSRVRYLCRSAGTSQETAENAGSRTLMAGRQR